MLWTLLIYVVLLSTIAVLWSKRKQAMFERNELQKAVYLADKRIGLLLRVKPENDLNSAEYKALTNDEQISTFEGWKIYHTLQQATISGEFNIYQGSGFQGTHRV